MDYQAILQSVSSVLPATVVVAVTIFITKEILEFFRRRSERARKLGAVKTLLSEELEKNHWTFRSMFGILDQIKEYSELFPEAKYNLVIARNGSEHYRVKREPNDDSWHGQAIPKFHDEQYKKLLPTLAELDAELFQKVNALYSELSELAHFRDTLIDFLSGDEWFVERNLNQSFLCHLATRRDKHYDSLSRTYSSLCGKALKELKVR